jgi:hypothetical protein
MPRLTCLLHVSLASSSQASAFLPRSVVAGGWKRFRVGRFSTTKDGGGDGDGDGDGHDESIPIKTIQADTDVDWNDRIGLQATWTNEKKGWNVDVEWRQTKFGAGLFALEDIPKDAIMRVGKNGRNLKEFQSLADIESYIQTIVKDEDEPSTAASVVTTTSRPVCNEARLSYVADYLWGFDPVADEGGYAYKRSSSNDESDGVDAPRFFGMWVPGNGLNHSPQPNTVYRPAQGGTDEGIHLMALTDIQSGDELFDDYRRHGHAPPWLLDFSTKYQVGLNFAECNTFVNQDGNNNE